MKLFFSLAFILATDFQKCEEKLMPQISSCFSPFSLLYYIMHVDTGPWKEWRVSGEALLHVAGPHANCQKEEPKQASIARNTADGTIKAQSPIPLLPPLTYARSNTYQYLHPHSTLFQRGEVEVLRQYSVTGPSFEATTSDVDDREEWDNLTISFLHSLLPPFGKKYFAL